MNGIACETDMSVYKKDNVTVKHKETFCDHYLAAVYSDKGHTSKNFLLSIKGLGSLRVTVRFVKRDYGLSKTYITVLAFVYSKHRWLISCNS